MEYVTYTVAIDLRITSSFDKKVVVVVVVVVFFQKKFYFFKL